MSSTVNEGAWDLTHLKDDSPAAKSNAWSHLLQTPGMARMVPLQHRSEVFMASVAGWGPEGQPWVPAHLARAYHEALGISFQLSDPQKYPDALLYGLTLAWGTEVASFHLAPEAAAVSFAVCDVGTQEPARAVNKRYAGAKLGARSTFKKQPPEEKYHNMAVYQEAAGGNAQVTGTGRKTREKAGRSSRIKSPVTRPRRGCERGVVHRDGCKKYAECWRASWKLTRSQKRWTWEQW